MGRKLKDEHIEENSDLSDESVPDGGWGWVVCFGAFLVNFILDGTMFSFGVLLLDLLEFFGQGKAKTAWVGSALLGMSMFMGEYIRELFFYFFWSIKNIFGVVCL